MKIFVTGATGYIGGAVAEELVNAGHRVVGLVQTAEGADRIRARGWEAVVGDLRDIRLLARLAGESDAVVHAANTGNEDAGAVDHAAVTAMVAALRGSEKRFLYTSGVWVLGPGSTDEETPADPPALVAWRVPVESEIVRAAPGVRGVIVRPGIVYGRGGGLPAQVARGEIPIVGSGAQRWPLVHVDDLARLYLRALEAAPAGALLHGVSSTLTMRDLVVLGRAAGGKPAEPISLEEARVRFGAFADALALDQLVSSRRTQVALAWRPRAPSPVEDLLAATHAAA